MSERQSVTVDVVSDVVCPWCFIGQKRLEKAVAAVPEVAVDIHWRPYQLDPTIPPEGKDRKQYMLAKFGSEERIREIHQRIEPLGAAEGIAFDFGAIKVAPNTLDAHRVIRWADWVAPRKLPSWSWRTTDCRRWRCRSPKPAAPALRLRRSG